LEELTAFDLLRDNVYLISDTHFFHKNVGIYCNRPNNWQELIVENWNSTINDNVVLHLGDFSFSNKREITEVVGNLNGTIYMVKGNHDRHGKQWYKDVGIEVIPSSYCHINGVNIYFSHRSMDTKTFNHGINIHGHTHEKGDFIYKRNGNVFVNMSVEQTNYYPLKAVDVIREARKMLGNGKDKGLQRHNVCKDFRDSRGISAGIL